LDIKIFIRDYCDQLGRLNYSKNTIRTYKTAFTEFVVYFQNQGSQNQGILIPTITYDEILAYLTKRANEDKISSSYQNQLINAIKFYYEIMLGQDKKFYYLKRPFKEEKLPKILSVDEITKLFSVITNVKHKAIIYTIYSCGLRISELIYLKFTDVDRKRMVVNIRQGKGKKDRVVNLEQETLDALENYYKSLKIKPKEYFFGGQSKVKVTYSTGSIQNFLRRYCIMAKIKVISPHGLRHSYATHLRDLGVDLATIQDLLGHDSPKSTRIYAKLSNNRINNLPKLIKNATQNK
jgi:site-specific recombinase XerD